MIPVETSYQSLPSGNHIVLFARPVTESAGSHTVVARMSSPNMNSWVRTYASSSSGQS